MAGRVAVDRASERERDRDSISEQASLITAAQCMSRGDSESPVARQPQPQPINKNFTLNH